MLTYSTYSFLVQ